MLRIYLAAVLLGGFACGAQAAVVAPLSVSGAWIRLLPGSLPAGGYFTLQNHADHAIRLTGATSPAYGSVQLHHSLESQGESRMVQVKAVTIPAHGQIRFAPGGYHLMLMKPRRPLQVGAHISITFEFADGQKLAHAFALRPASAQGP